MVILCIACRQKNSNNTIERGFYFWKTTLSISDFEYNKIDSLNISTMYVRLFDVGWNTESKTPTPIGKISLQHTEPLQQKKINIVPVIFITNECIAHVDSTQIASLSDNIFKLSNQLILQLGSNGIKEIQLDCDWTTSTKEKYFALLQHCKKLWPNITISATIRLHQIKYSSKTGIPPVKKGMLMCYNMGNLKNPSVHNSIIDANEMAQYVSTLDQYPLELDIAWPIFDWNVIFRNNAFAGISYNINVKDPVFNPLDDNRFRLTKDTLMNNVQLYAGDIIRQELSNINTIKQCNDLINDKIHNTHLRVSLFHLDSIILSKYTCHELEAIYNGMH